LVPGEPARLIETRPDPQEAERWTLREFAPCPGYVAALAVEGPVRTVTFWQWPGHDAW
jgi:4'-phosphopantetheinyl transferase